MSSAVALSLTCRFNNVDSTLWWRSAPSGVLPLGDFPRTTDAVTAWAQKQPGQFAAAIELEKATYLITDFARSIPLFYARLNDQWVVSDDFNALIDLLPDPKRDVDAADVFRHCGVVPGQKTLIEGVYQVPAASIVTLPHDATTATSSLYRGFVYTHDYEGRDDVFEACVLQTLRERFQALVNNAADRLLVLPLSGGIDSRLMATLLKEIPEARLLTFTYGQKDSREAKLSQQVANELGIQWVFVESAPTNVRSAWSEYGHAFVRNAWAGASLPHYQDWYALHVLTANGTIPEGSIILPGHTIVGGMHDGHILEDPQPMSSKRLTNVLLKHHGNLQGSPEQAASLPYMRHALQEFFIEVGYDASLDQRQSVVEWFNLRERQAKYINNSMRAYEHFGLDWALPMLDAPFVELWQKGSRYAVEEKREWYRKVTNRLYEQATGHEVQYFSTAVNQLPPHWKRFGVAVAETTGIATLLRRVLSAKTQMNHPMAFHSLLDDDQVNRIILRRALRGSSLQGEFVDRFLTNQWTRGDDILPPPHSSTHQTV